MQRRFSTQQALEMVLEGINPCDSDGEEINVQPDSDSELSSGKIQFHIICYFIFHFRQEGGNSGAHITM